MTAREHAELADKLITDHSVGSFIHDRGEDQAAERAGVHALIALALNATVGQQRRKVEYDG